MAYDYNIDTPNLFGNFVRGQEITEQRKQRALENQQIEQDRAQKEQDRTQQTVANFSRQWASAAPQAKPLLARVARQAISQNPALAEALGGQVPETDDPAEWDNFMGGGALLGEPQSYSNAGNGFMLGNQGDVKQIPGFQDARPNRLRPVMVPMADGTQRQMLFDPDTGGFSDPSYGGQPQAPQAPPPTQYETSIDINSLPPGEREAAIMASQGQDAHVVNGQAIPGNTLTAQQDFGARGPQARRSYADTPMDQVGGGAVAPRQFGVKPAARPKTSAATGQKAPAGYRWTGDGAKLEPIPGGPADRSQKGGAARPQAPVRPTEDMAKAAAWYAQANNAYANLRRIYDRNPAAAAPGVVETYGPAGEVANRSRSADRQQYVQAASSLSEAFLRAATGAGITIDEAKQKFEELTPVRGDGPEVIQQKLDAIPVYLESLKNRAGAAIPSANAPNAADASAPLPRLDGGNNGWSIRVKK